MRKTNDDPATRAARRRLPSLRALRAFEAVAYHRSFTLAANELAVSQGAVSHQVKQLEETLGLPVFQRSARGVTLTPQGVLLWETCERAFNEIGETLALIRNDRETQVLRVRAGPFFAMKVIAPRISNFMNDTPGVQLHLNNLRDSVSTPGRDDVFIEYGETAPGGVHSTVILQEKLVPVASPDLMRTAAAPLELLQQPRVTRLNYRDLRDWQVWLETAGLKPHGAHPNLVFDDQHTIIEAARSGLGVALADRALIHQDVQRGRLVILSEDYIEPAACYRLVCAEASIAERPHIDRFKQWLTREIAAIQSAAGF